MPSRTDLRPAKAGKTAWRVLRAAPLACFFLLISIAAMAPSPLGAPVAWLGGLSLYLALSILLFLAQVLLVLLPTPGEAGN